MQRVFRVLVLLVCGAAAAEAAEPRAVLLLTGTGIPWREARRIIEQFGGHVAIVASPDVLVGFIPEGADAALREASARAAGPVAAAASSLRIIRTRADAETLLLGAAGVVAQAPAATVSSEARAALRLLAPQIQPVDQDPQYRVLPGGLIEIRPMSDWESPPLPPPQPVPGNERLANALGNTFENTSGFLAGDIGVGILRPESTGAVDAINTQDWTAGEVANSLAQVLASLDKLTNDSPRGKVTFVVRTESFGAGVAGTVACDYEAIEYANWTSSVVLNFLGKLGYAQSDFFQRLREWANDIRSDLGTDWAFGVVVVDNSTDTTKGRASAYLNGPGEWLFQSNPASVYHHESGHVFGAQDEYHPDAAKSPIGLWGYTQEVNANSQYNDGTGFFSGAGEGIPALQIDNRDYISPWGRGALGIWDLDGDGINDTQDTFPTVSLNAPTGTSTLTFTGTASATPLKRETGTYLNADLTINKITAVEWRVNSGAWQDATPGDGSLNSSSENFTFTTPTLRNGPYVVEARAKDNFGNVTTIYPRLTVTASGSIATNNMPMPALAVTPSLGSIATSFQFSAAGSIDAEDSENLLYRWDYENDGTYDTVPSGNPVTSHSYGTPGSKTAKLEVQDRSGAVATRTVSIAVSATNVPPTATFNVDKGVLFAQIPSAMFDFDSSGVADGEDPTSILQVRWDFEDDSIWDTSFSTSKTIQHDYAERLPVTASNETGNTFIYGGNSVNGYAESFIAGSTSIGQAELMLKHNNDNTAGGTCTTGIRSSLTSAFLTSVSKDQTSFKEGDWNLFDFPDITVTNGAVYYLVIVCSDGDIMWSASSADPYAGGEHYYSFNSGTSWGSNTMYDHVFRIYDSVPAAVPLTKSKAWRVRMEVMDSNGQTTQTVRDIWTNAYDRSPTVSLGSSTLSGTTGTTFNLTATGADADSATLWDGLLHYRWDVDGDGNFETEFDAANTRNAIFAQAGTYQTTVEVRDRYHATARVSVVLTVTPASGATQITKLAGDNQTASPGGIVSTAPSVIVQNALNNPVAGVAVVFSVLSGGGTLTNATQTTNASGIATLGSWTLGSPGPNSLGVKMPHFPQASLLTFNGTASAGRTLTISKAGTGSGTVTSNIEGISCGAICSVDFPDGSTVTLTAAPSASNTFAGWTGAGCSGVGTCQVIMDAAKTVTATFSLEKKVRGQVTSN